MTRTQNSDLAYGRFELTANTFKLMTYYYSEEDGWNFDTDVIASH